jgi:hypothetical protein
MGNTASVGTSAPGALDSYVAELGDGVIYEKRSSLISVAVSSIVSFNPTVLDIRDS